MSVSMSGSLSATGGKFDPVKNSLMFQPDGGGYSISKVTWPNGLVINIYTNGYTVTEGKQTTFFPGDPSSVILMAKSDQNAKLLQAIILDKNEYKALDDRLAYLNSGYDPAESSGKMFDPTGLFDLIANLPFFHKQPLTSSELAERDALRSVMSLNIDNRSIPAKYSAFMQKMDNIMTLGGRGIPSCARNGSKSGKPG